MIGEGEEEDDRDPTQAGIPHNQNLLLFLPISWPEQPMGGHILLALLTVGLLLIAVAVTKLRCWCRRAHRRSRDKECPLCLQFMGLRNGYAVKPVPELSASLSSTVNSLGINRAALTNVRELMATSLKRIRQLEDEVKAIPLLQVLVLFILYCIICFHCCI